MERKMTFAVVILAVAFSTVDLSAQTEINQTACDSCGAASGQWGYGNGFGYRNDDGSTRRQRWEANFDVTKQQADLIAQRNDAWPKPFQCYDRQAYHAVWAVTSTSGWANECTLTPEHFDALTNRLNRAGQSKIAGIMNNLPEPARQIWVYNDGNAGLAQARLASVNELLSEHFGDLPTPTIAMTRQLPHGMSGQLVEDVQQKFVQALPLPKVPAASGTTITGK